MFNQPQREALRITPDEARALERLKAYRTDFPRYARECLRVVDRQSKLSPLLMNPAQMILHAKADAQLEEFGMVRVVLLKGRKMGACLTPDTRVMLSDCRWKPVSDVQPGDKVLSVDENPGGETASGRKQARKMREAKVIAKAYLRDEVFEITLSNGTVLKATGDHRWLTRQRSGCLAVWRAVKDMRVGDHLRAATYAPCDDPIDLKHTFEGRKLPTSSPGFDAHPEITHVRSLGVMDVVDLQTSTKTFIAEGIVSHNSTFIGARFYRATQLWKHRAAAVMAHVQPSTEILFRMVQTFHQNNPLALPADNSSAKLYAFENGSTYTVSTAGGRGESGRGGSLALAHMSEVAFYPNAQKNFAAFAGSVPMQPGTEIWAESTANGMGNEFHRRWSLAEAGVSDGTDSLAYKPVFIPWFIDPDYRIPVPDSFAVHTEPEGDGLPSERDLAEMYGLSNEQLAWRRYEVNAEFGGSVELFMQEYPNTPQEAFQKIGMDLFIKPIYVARARRRHDIPAVGPKILGVDPAGLGGDKFCLCLRQGHVVHWYRGRVGMEPGEEQVEWVAGVMMDEGVDRCNIDYSGGWGTALLAGLRERYPRLAERCYAVDFGAKSQFKMVKPHAPGPRNRRAEMYMRAREWFENPEGVSIPDDSELQSDLGAITARIGGQSTDTLITPKIEIKKILGHSPDVADSFVLSFASPDSSVRGSLTAGRINATSEFAQGATDSRPVVRDDFATGARGSRYGFDSGGGWMT